VLVLQRLDQGEVVVATLEHLQQHRPEEVVLGTVVDLEVPAEELPAERGVEPAVRVGRASGDLLDVAAERIVERDHDRGVERAHGPAS
jgi:hypothetical protein